MKKLSLILSGLLILSLAFTSCSTGSGDKSGTGENGGNGGGSQGTTTKKVTVYTIDAATTTALDGHSWYIASISLQDYAKKTVNVSFESDMKTENSGAEASLTWTLNVDSYPTVASNNFPAGTSEWVNVKGSVSDIALGDYPVIYISTYGITPANFKIYLKNIKITVTEAADSTNTKTYTEMATGDGITKTTVTESGSDSGSGSGSGSGDGDNITRENYNWLSAEVPSLLETYSDQFEYIGIAAEYGNFGLQQNGSNKYTATYTHSGWGTPSELYYEEIQNGIKKHANSITLGNELKPQFLLQWWDGDGSKQEMVDYTGSNGKSIKVPKSLNGEKLIYATLNVCKAMDVKMRGHVLTWHSQTPDGFFAVDYKPTYDKSGAITNLVDKETMTARHEWYIQTVLNCVGAWETANNYKAIWAWDVVNEAMADDADNSYTGSSQTWLRGSTAGTKDKAPDKGGSRWYQIYENEEFIINAFKFAVEHGPDDIMLCYNDYNEYWDAPGHYKTSAIEHIAGLIKDTLIEIGNDDEDRFVIAMQSHVGTSWPGVDGYEKALKRFLEIADVHVSEIDFSAETQAEGTKAWGDYFKMLQKYGNDYSDTHRITNVTIWGINNESSWINPSSAGGKKTYPLLFNLVNNVNTNVKEVTYDTGDETLPQYDVGDSYITNDAFWAVINAHN